MNSRSLLKLLPLLKRGDIIHLSSTIQISKTYYCESYGEYLVDVFDQGHESLLTRNTKLYHHYSHEVIRSLRYRKLID